MHLSWGLAQTPFSFKINCHTMVEELSLLYYLPIAGRGIVGFRPFLSVSVLCKMQTAEVRIWTLVAESTSYNDNCYTTSASCDIPVKKPTRYRVNRQSTGRDGFMPFWKSFCVEWKSSLIQNLNCCSTCTVKLQNTMASQKVGDRSRRWPKGFLFNSYYSEV